MPLVILLTKKMFDCSKNISSSKLTLFDIIAFIKSTDFLTFSQFTIVFGANVIKLDQTKSKNKILMIIARIILHFVMCKKIMFSQNWKSVFYRVKFWNRNKSLSRNTFSGHRDTWLKTGSVPAKPGRMATLLLVLLYIVFKHITHLY